MQFRINPNTIINNYNKDKTVQTSEEKINLRSTKQTEKAKTDRKKWMIWFQSITPFLKIKIEGWVKRKLILFISI